MLNARPYVLSIAGFDPSGGAGILADIKSFENLKTIGLGVITANTIQTEDTFVKPNWIKEEEILEQLNTILSKYKVEFCKIGLIKSEAILKKLIKVLKSHNSEIKIIWDPIISASSGFDFHQNFSKEILKDLFLITPNLNEIHAFNSEKKEAKEIAIELSAYCNVYLKGGHNEENKGKDFLFTKEGKIHPFNPKKATYFSKHGSGCIFSSALTASLAKNKSLIKSCLIAKDCVSKALKSNKSLLAYHS